MLSTTWFITGCKLCRFNVKRRVLLVHVETRGIGQCIAWRWTMLTAQRFDTLQLGNAICFHIYFWDPSSLYHAILVELGVWRKTQSCQLCGSFVVYYTPVGHSDKFFVWQPALWKIASRGVTQKLELLPTWNTFPPLRKHGQQLMFWIGIKSTRKSCWSWSF